MARVIVLDNVVLEITVKHLAKILARRTFLVFTKCMRFFIFSDFEALG